MKKLYKAGSLISYLWDKISGLIAPSGKHIKVGDSTVIYIINVGPQGNSPPNININVGRVEKVRDINYTETE